MSPKDNIGEELFRYESLAFTFSPNKNVYTFKTLHLVVTFLIYVIKIY